jgi:hypothetical protein
MPPLLTPVRDRAVSERLQFHGGGLAPFGFVMDPTSAHQGSTAGQGSTQMNAAAPSPPSTPLETSRVSAARLKAAAAYDAQVEIFWHTIEMNGRPLSGRLER